jgi:tetraacyldisaccharide 4'-kinase
VIRLAVQRSLERGVAPSFATALLARAWEKHARVTRALTVKVPTLCVSGATLGGSGRTPLAIACARSLARAGHRVALVGHAYAARAPRRAHRVAPHDDPRIVGDEAIECARSLDGLASVFVARDKQHAIHAAEAHADVLVLDGPLQLAPRATLSLLAVDARDPWGSGACPPLGNLRASRAALIAAADSIVAVAPTSRGVFIGGALVSYDVLRASFARVGLTTAIARPERVLALLRAHGIEPDAIACAADHGALRTDEDAVDLWLTTAKDFARTKRTQRLAVIDYHLDLPPAVEALLRSRFPARF